MKRLILTLILGCLSYTGSGAESTMKKASKETVAVSKLELAILKRSLLLLGGNHRPNIPLFNRMDYRDLDDELVQSFTVTSAEVDKALAGDEETVKKYLFMYKMERSVLLNYIRLEPNDAFKMEFSTVGGGKGFVVTKDGIKKR